MDDSDLQRALGQATDALRDMLLRENQKLTLPETAFTLNTLPDTPELNGVRTQLALRLRTQLSIPWIKKGDTFDVFAALTALWKYQQTDITGEHLACAIRRLIEYEVATGGPYYSNGKVDIAANTQIALFMRLVAKPLPKLDAFLAKAIATQHFGDVRLTRPYLLYLLGQACPTMELTQYIAEHWHQKNWQTPWRKAIALAILKKSAQASEIKRSLTALFAWQHHNGFWNGESLLKTQPAAANSRLTTSALIIAVLADYQHAHIHTAPSALGQHHTIKQAAKQIFTTCNGPLRASAFATIKQMCDADKNFEITLLPHFFAQALNTSKSLTDQQRTTLGLASLYVWMAYTIYDDFLDDEGVPAKLPVANIAMRASLDCFRAALPDQTAFLQYVARTFTAMDEANAWEVNHCRFTVTAKKIIVPKLPTYGGGSLLAARSFAHALAPMAVLAQLLPHNPKACINRVESAFRHYLIARQLNDDIHDWLKDTRAGQASYAVTAILRDLRVRPGAYRLSALLPAMQKRFRLTTMPRICQRILWHTDKSRKAFAKSKLLHTPNNIYSLLDNLEQSVQYSLDQHSKTQDFYASTRKFGWE